MLTTDTSIEEGRIVEKNWKTGRKGGRRIEFEYFAPEAKEVQLAGSFNNWDQKATPLRKGPEGRWSVSIHLQPGRYEYRYLVDNLWQNDQRSVECVPNAFGSWNCVIEVR